MYDFKDGSFCTQHHLFREHCIQILAYFDDIEVTNPIGAHIPESISLVFSSGLCSIYLLLSDLACHVLML